MNYLLSTFDMLNVSDLSLIEQASESGQNLVVGVLSDEDTASFFGRPPVIPLSERVELVSHVRGVFMAVPHRRDAAVDAEQVFISADLRERLDLLQAPVTLLPARETASVVLRKALATVERPSSDAEAVA